MTKLLRLTLIAFAVIALANVIVSIPLPFNESHLNKRLIPINGDRHVVNCNGWKRCPPHLGGGSKGGTNPDPHPIDDNNNDGGDGEPDSS
ncbi:8341_t:CDS:2 [Paraglomus brasilianum]|uniref:8341_t:CDS:1 n=1 Tax=Paraglomus brasilianum TaxID=144538 RepID=A0A9N9CXX3_9GLOM|nr:8341_t:CDS:2 [Paraglomus brasilianum]